jgi:hypothetical protein
MSWVETCPMGFSLRSSRSDFRGETEWMRPQGAPQIPPLRYASVGMTKGRVVCFRKISRWMRGPRSYLACEGGLHQVAYHAAFCSQACGLNAGLDCFHYRAHVLWSELGSLAP